MQVPLLLPARVHYQSLHFADLQQEVVLPGLILLTQIQCNEYCSVSNSLHEGIYLKNVKYTLVNHFFFQLWYPKMT